MDIDSLTVTLGPLRMHGRHGVMEHERVAGNDFEVSVAVDLDRFDAALTDDLSHTVNYARVHDVVKAVMARPSQLLEHVAAGIARGVLDAEPAACRVTVTVTKLRPPIDGCTGPAGVTLTARR